MYIYRKLNVVSFQTIQHERNRNNLQQYLFQLNLVFLLSFQLPNQQSMIKNWIENQPNASQLSAAHFSGYLLCQVVPSVPSQNKASSEYGKYSPENYPHKLYVSWLD